MQCMKQFYFLDLIGFLQWCSCCPHRLQCEGRVEALHDSDKKIVALINSSSDHLILIQTYAGA